MPFKNNTTITRLSGSNFGNGTCTWNYFVMFPALFCLFLSIQHRLSANNKIAFRFVLLNASLVQLSPNQL